MSDDQAKMLSQGSTLRARWIQLTVLGIIAVGLWSLIGGWVQNEHAIAQAVTCQPACLDRQQAVVEKTETYTSNGTGIYGGSTTTFRAWLDVNGSSQKIDNRLPQLEEGARVSVELLNGRVVMAGGKQVWNGWAMDRTAGLVFLFPFALLATLGALTQVAALALHGLRIRRSTDLSTSGAAGVGGLTGVPIVIVGYLLIHPLPWYWVYVGAGGGLAVTAFCVSLVIYDAPRP